MHHFAYGERAESLLCPEIVGMLVEIHKYIGRQGFLLEQKKDRLVAFAELAIFESTDSSNRIEGIKTTAERFKKLVMQKIEPQNQFEQEIMGYFALLTCIHESYEYMRPRPSVILQLHRDLFSYSLGGGKYKFYDNSIIETDSQGNERVRFQPVSAYQTAEYMERMCEEFLKEWDSSTYEKLLLIPLFVLDFLCIHPFSDGNGRVSRLLTLLLCYHAEIQVGKYISLEMLIEKTKESYYESLQYSSFGWHEEKNSDKEFVQYFLGIILKAYRDFENRVEHVGNKSKVERVCLWTERRLGTFTKQDILRENPDISQYTVERILNRLVTEGTLEKVEKSKKIVYVRKIW